MPNDDKALDHAWAYFELHAQQRITVFNYFVVFAGILTTAIAAAIQASREMALIGAALGVLLVLLSLVFWGLDFRTSFLIKHAESRIAALEPADAALVGTEKAATDAHRAQNRFHLSYGKLFRIIFFAMMIIGAAGSVLSGLRAADLVRWKSDKAEAQVVANIAFGVPPHPTTPAVSSSVPPQSCGGSVRPPCRDKR